MVVFQHLENAGILVAEIWRMMELCWKHGQHGPCTMYLTNHICDKRWCCELSPSTDYRVIPVCMIPECCHWYPNPRMGWQKLGKLVVIHINWNKTALEKRLLACIINSDIDIIWNWNMVIVELIDIIKIEIDLILRCLWATCRFRPSNGYPNSWGKYEV